jgi:hypothetical protein
MSLARTACTAAALMAATLVLPLPAAGENAEYQVTFESTWSQATHPMNFPLNAHYSPLNGGTHNDQVSFWAHGALATAGIRLMAEQGNTDTLSAEVQGAVLAGTADQVLLGPAMALSPGSVGMNFTVDETYPLVTLVTMIAPSPDWFVGVSGLSLRDNGTWVPEIVVPLVAYDSGTDSGPSYISPNQPTMPRVPIAELTSGPFAEDSLVGTFTFTLVNVVGLDPLAGPAGLQVVGPNPLRGGTRFAIRIPDGRSGTLAVYGIDGRRVRTLFDGATFGQTRFVEWNGQDGRGTRVPAGMYFGSLRGESQAPETRRIVVAR